jgi:hypothetical protein
MIMSNGPDISSLLGAIISAIAPPRRPEPRSGQREHPAPEPTTTQPPSEPEIVDRRDERGGKHPGDFPNPTDGVYKGCF